MSDYKVIDQAVDNELVVPKDWGFTTSKEKGTPCFWMEFEFQDIAPGPDQRFVVRKDWWITDNTIDFVLRDLQTLGWAGGSLDELSRESSNAHSFFYAKVRITVNMENFDGRDYPKVSYINPEDYTPMRKPMESKDFNILSGKLKGKIAAYRAKNKVAAKNGSKAKDPVFSADASDEARD